MKETSKRILIMALLLLGGALSIVHFSQATVGTGGHGSPSNGDASGEGRSSSEAARTLFVIDETVGTATTGDPFVLKANVSGIDDIVQVFVEYWYDNRTTAITNASMTTDVVDTGGRGTYVLTIPNVPYRSVDPLRYRYSARNALGVWTDSPNYEMAVSDNDPPWFGNDTSDARAIAGRPFHFEVEVFDNINVAEVDLNYWLNGSLPSTKLMSANGSDRFTYDLPPLPADNDKSLWYYFQAVDGADHWVRTNDTEARPRDDRPPVFVADLTTPLPPVKGMNITFSVDFTDNIGVVGAKVEYWIGQGHPVNVSMARSVSENYWVNVSIPRRPSGDLNYRFYAWDADGNQNNTDTAMVSPVDIKPVLDGSLVWNVVEDTIGRFDLTSHIMDPNDPIGSINLTCDAPNIRVEGLTLVLKYPYGTPISDYPLVVTLSDSETTSTGQILIHIIPVNDPPIFKSTPPTAAEVGVAYSYMAAVQDEEGDTLTFWFLEAPQGMSLDTTGGQPVVSWTPTRAQHDYHRVRLAASDGNATTLQEWSILVTVSTQDPNNRPPAFTNEPSRNATLGPYSWDAAALDPDGDTLYFHLLQGPPGASINNTTGKLGWEPPPSSGPVDYIVRFGVEVTDGLHDVSNTFDVRVRSPADRPPEILGKIPDIQAKGEVRLNLTNYMSDGDDPIDNLTWRFERSDGGGFTVTISGNSVVITPRTGEKGSGAVTMVLEDPSGTIDSQIVGVNYDGRSGILSGPWIWLIILIILIIVVVAAFASSRARRAQRTGTMAVATEGGGRTFAAALEGRREPVPKLAKVARGPNYFVEEVLVVYRDGRLIADCAREECKTKDADLMSGMLITIQGIIQDGLERGGALESIKYGDNTILMACGDHINIATVIYGEPDEDLKDRLAAMLAKIEGSFAGVIEDWTGDLSVFKGIDVMMAALLKPTAGLKRSDIIKTEAYVGVTMLSAVDFHRGYVRLKVATINATKDVIVDAAVEVRYDPDMLRLERVDPSTIKMRGDRATLSNVKPGEKKTVAFLFDPQICQETHIDGTLTYYDTKGELQRVEMKRRQADVVCPIFFTKEHANTAMLRRLIKEKLDQSDVRLFTYPKELSPEVALVLGKSVAGGDRVQLVREFVVEGPPFEAEVWYYGETKVKGYQMVMRLSVLDGKKAIEFFAASTAMEPVTGLLAEFRRDLERMLEEKYAGTVKVQTVRDEVLKRELELRQLFLFTFGEREE